MGEYRRSGRKNTRIRVIKTEHVVAWSINRSVTNLRQVLRHTLPPPFQRRPIRIGDGGIWLASLRMTSSSCSFMIGTTTQEYSKTHRIGDGGIWFASLRMTSSSCSFRIGTTTKEYSKTHRTVGMTALCIYHCSPLGISDYLS